MLQINWEVEILGTAFISFHCNRVGAYEDNDNSFTFERPLALLGKTLIVRWLVQDSGNRSIDQPLKPYLMF